MPNYDTISIREAFRAAVRILDRLPQEFAWGWYCTDLVDDCTLNIYISADKWEMMHSLLALPETVFDQHDDDVERFQSYRVGPLVISFIDQEPR